MDHFKADCYTFEREINPEDGLLQSSMRLLKKLGTEIVPYYRKLDDVNINPEVIEKLNKEDFLEKKSNKPKKLTWNNLF